MVEGPYDLTWSEYAVFTAGGFAVVLVILAIAAWRHRP